MSRSPLAAVVLATALVGSLAACNGGGSGKATKPHRTTTTTSSSSTTTVPGGATTTVPPTPTSSTTPSEPVGTCGNQTTAIVSAIGASDVGGLNTRKGQYSVKLCRIAASSPIWAAAAIIPNPGVQLDRATVVLQRIGALWNVEQVGTSRVGCNAPGTVISDLGLVC